MRATRPDQPNHGGDFAAGGAAEANPSPGHWFAVALDVRGSAPWSAIPAFTILSRTAPGRP
jgi:hypothetical protein